MPATCTQVAIPYLPDQAICKTYENGYQFIFVPKKGDVFNVSTWVKTGSIHEDDINNGVSHFLEHLMFKGTERFAPGEFDKAMESMGAVINAATWKDFTFYYVTGPKGSQGQNFEKALDMHADMLLFSTLPDAEIGQQHNPDDPNSTAVKRERGVVIEEINMRDDQPWTKVYNAVNEMMYPPGHPYRRDVIGTRQIIGNIPRKAIESYYWTWYSPQNLATIVVGDFDPDWLEAKVLAAFDFNRLKRPTDSPAPFVWTGSSLPTYDGGQRFERIEGDFQTAFLIAGAHGPTPDDLKETIALDVASRILGEGRSSRLYQALIEKPREPVFNMISCGQSTFKLGNVFMIQANFNGADDAARLAEIEAEVTALCTTRPITAEEFTRTVKNMKVHFAETSETASGIADSVGESLTVTGTLNTYTGYLAQLNALTLGDVQAAAEHWLPWEKAFVSVLVPRDGASEAEGASA